LNPRGILTGHDDVRRNAGETEPPIVGLVAHEENERPAEIRCPGQSLEDERATDAGRAPARVRRDGAQEEGRSLGQADRPIADGTDYTLGFFRDPAESGDPLDTLSISVGDLPPPLGAECRIQEGFNDGIVGFAFEAELEHGAGSLAGETETSRQPSDRPCRRLTAQRRIERRRHQRRRSRAIPAEVWPRNMEDAGITT
jgi:hypothetical protein